MTANQAGNRPPLGLQCHIRLPLHIDRNDRRTFLRSETAASADSFGCSNVCFNRRIQEKFQLKKTENGIEIAETPCQH